MENSSDEVLIADAQAVSQTDIGAEKIYHAGTLRYTFRGLLFLSLWLLWGNFAFIFFESIFTRFIPLYLQDLHASNTLIGVMTGSFVGFVNFFFLPNISQWSDRYRSRFGRRIPFLCAVAPITVISLVAIGFAPEIAHGIFPLLHAGFLVHVIPAISERALVLALLCAFVVSYHFFNMVLFNAYNWLLRDVIPLEQMARFLSWFQIVNTASTFAFLWFVFPFAVTYRKEVFLGVGLFYLIAFLLMCFNVKEGDYPPVPPKEARPGVLRSFVLYFRECLILPIYRNLFITYILFILASSCSAPFAILFTRDTLGLSMDTIGKVFAWQAAASTLIYFPMGWLCDRFNPLLVTLGAMVGYVFVSVLACLLIHSRESLLVYAVVAAIPSVGWTLGVLATTMKLFPEEKFGQFSSGMNVFSCGALIFGNYLIGKFMDLSHSNYRLTFLWSAALIALAIYPMTLVYREWKRHGGPDHYTPPLPPSL